MGVSLVFSKYFDHQVCVCYPVHVERLDAIKFAVLGNYWSVLPCWAADVPQPSYPWRACLLSRGGRGYPCRRKCHWVLAIFYPGLPGLLRYATRLCKRLCISAPNAAIKSGAHFMLVRSLRDGCSNTKKMAAEALRRFAANNAQNCNNCLLLKKLAFSL